MNVLSLGATFGALVWIFQDGHLSGLLGFDPPGALDLIMPVVVFVFAFGLSMDYEVFMLARIKEAYDETRATTTARSRIGLQRSGKIITSAALLIVIVFAGFTTGEIVAMKQLGLGLALAVVIDATIVRMLPRARDDEAHGQVELVGAGLARPRCTAGSGCMKVPWRSPPVPSSGLSGGRYRPHAWCTSTRIGCRRTWRSSWTATGGGRSSAG